MGCVLGKGGFVAPSGSPEVGCWKLGCPLSRVVDGVVAFGSSCFLVLYVLSILVWF